GRVRRLRVPALRPSVPDRQGGPEGDGPAPAVRISAFSAPGEPSSRPTRRGSGGGGGGTGEVLGDARPAVRASVRARRRVPGRICHRPRRRRPTFRGGPGGRRLR